MQCIQLAGDFRKAAVGSCSVCCNEGRHTGCGNIAKMDLQLKLLDRSSELRAISDSTSRTHAEGERLGLVHFRLTLVCPEKKAGLDEDSSFMSRFCNVLSAGD